MPSYGQFLFRLTSTNHSTVTLTLQIVVQKLWPSPRLPQTFKWNICHLYCFIWNWCSMRILPKYHLTFVAWNSCQVLHVQHNIIPLSKYQAMTRVPCEMTPCGVMQLTNMAFAALYLLYGGCVINSLSELFMDIVYHNITSVEADESSLAVVGCNLCGLGVLILWTPKMSRTRSFSFVVCMHKYQGGWWMLLSFFTFLFQCTEHGFPHKPSCLAYDPKLKLLAIGTKSGALKVYPFVDDKPSPM